MPFRALPDRLIVTSPDDDRLVLTLAGGVAIVWDLLASPLTAVEVRDLLSADGLSVDVHDVNGTIDELRAVHLVEGV